MRLRISVSAFSGTSTRNGRTALLVSCAIAVISLDLPLLCARCLEFAARAHRAEARPYAGRPESRRRRSTPGSVTGPLGGSVGAVARCQATAPAALLTGSESRGGHPRLLAVRPHDGNSRLHAARGPTPCERAQQISRLGGSSSERVSLRARGESIEG